MASSIERSERRSTTLLLSRKLILDKKRLFTVCGVNDASASFSMSLERLASTKPFLELRNPPLSSGHDSIAIALFNKTGRYFLEKHLT